MSAARRMLVEEAEQTIPVLTVVEAPVEAPATPVAAPKSPFPFKGVSFGGIKSAKESTGRKSYPLFPDPDGTAATLAKTVIELSAQVEQFELTKKMLAEMVTPFYFGNASGKVDVPSSVEVGSADGTVMVTFQNRYKNATDPDALVKILGPEAVERYFKQGFTLKVDGDKIPEQHAQVLVDEMQQLFVKYGAVESLSVAPSVKPLPTFHAARHLCLKPEQNTAVDEVCGIVKVVRPAAARKSGRIDPTKA